MRMWMCKPEEMCRQHLLGEYREVFTFIGTLKRKKSVKGYIRNGLLEPLALEKRYEELKAEMVSRGYKPVAKFEMPDGLLSYLTKEEIEHKVDDTVSRIELARRCERCRELQQGKQEV